MLANMRGGVRNPGAAVAPRQDEIYLSFLPLSHSFEHTVGQFFFLMPRRYCRSFYARGVEHLAADLHDGQPPRSSSVVPRILDVVRTRILLQR